MAVDVDAPHGVVDVSPGMVFAIVDASRELLVNVARHSGVAHATWRVRRHADEVVVSVEDTGQGFGPASTPGVGLTLSVQDRIDRVGGQVEIDSSPSGTRVHLRLPAARRRARLSLAEAFDLTLHVPGAVHARSLALLVALPMLAVHTTLGLRHGLLDADQAAIQWATWVVVVLCTWAFAQRLDRGAPAVSNAVALVVVIAGMLLISLESAGEGAARGSESWMIGAFTVPLMVLAYVAPLHWTPAVVLPDLAIVMVTIAADPTTTWSQTFGALSTPFLPLMAGLLGHLQRRGARDLAAERARLVDAEVRSRTAARRRDVEHRYLDATLDQVVPFLEDLAAGRHESSATLDTRVTVLAGLVRDDLYAPGLMSPALRALAQQHRERGGQLMFRTGITRDGFGALEPPLARALEDAPAGSTVTVSPVAEPPSVRIVVAHAEDAESVDVPIAQA